MDDFQGARLRNLALGCYKNKSEIPAIAECRE
jgi:hypothetical protein